MTFDDIEVNPDYAAWFVKTCFVNTETCIVTYRVNLFNKVFPELVGGGRLSNYEITSRATFGWWDFT